MDRSSFAVLTLCLGSLPISGQAPAVAIGDSAVAASTFEDAQQLAAKGRLDQAMNVLNELAAQTPTPAGVERLRGLIFYQKDQLSEAVEAFKKAVAQDSNDRESIEMEGVSLFRQGHPREALG